MALTDTDKFSGRDYLQQVDRVEREITASEARDVLELGCGKGFNLYHLAQRLPHVQFVGFDYSALHARQSHHRLKSFQNTSIMRADFHNIPVSANSCDVVFEFESICHALDMKCALQSIYHTLKSGGTFILFDGFRIRPMDQLSENEKIARCLVEKPLGVQEGTFINEFLLIAQEIGFEVKCVHDLSSAILPNLQRIQAIQKFLFPTNFQLWLAQKLLPKYLVRNVIAAMLMPYMVESGIQGYFQINLQRH
ncbi:MAG: class I SAM-dependent methyltransferase [Chloroflexota bacterium]